MGYQTTPPPVSYSDPKSWAELAEPLRSRLWQARLDCAAEHPTWVLLGLNSGKRTDWMQFCLRTPDRGIPAGHQYDPAYKGHPLTALPGRSNHRNLGWVNGKLVAAADLYRNPALDWLHNHQPEYGIHFPMASEYWHAECYGEPTAHINPYDTPVEKDWLDMASEADVKKIVAETVKEALKPIVLGILADEATDKKEAKRASDQSGSHFAYEMAAYEAANPGKTWRDLAKRAGEIDKENTFAEVK